MPCSLFAQVASTSGELDFLLGSNTIATLNAQGFGIGVGTPTANLHVQGNAVIDHSLAIGTASAQANLHLQGSMSMSFTSLAANATLGEWGSDSVVFANTSNGNLTLNLPYAGNVSGRIISVKKTSSLYSLYLTGGGNDIDGFGTVEFAPDSNLAAAELMSIGPQWVMTSSFWQYRSTSGSPDLL